MDEGMERPSCLSLFTSSLAHSGVLALLGIILFVFLLFCFILGELDQLGCVPVVVTSFDSFDSFGRLYFLFGGGEVIRGKEIVGWWMEILRIPFC